MPPEYIHMRVAESILFMVSHQGSPKSKPFHSISRHFIQSADKKGFQKLIGSAGPFQREPFLDVEMIGEELLSQSGDDKIETMLLDLKLVIVRADLNGHLNALKDYFLLAKRDFFQATIKTISEEGKYFSRVSLQMPSFGITVKSSQRDLSKTKTFTDGSSETSLDGWDSIALEYSVDWPLQLFFTQEVFSK
ncbi:Detected protein of confused Function [Hibiscus syriacus]|uniref:Gamma-tubulin complex component n=1 Tax=Hibiscus syriacus TaxID=106335 RepID=A0A6A3BTB2_HIBSY|nr:Detected protein of confused Function [Hibiscus syriacus]